MRMRLRDDLNPPVILKVEDRLHEKGGVVVEAPQPGIALFAKECPVGAGESVIVVDGQPGVLWPPAWRFFADGAQAVLFGLKFCASLWGDAIELLLHVLPAGQVVFGRMVPVEGQFSSAWLAEVPEAVRGRAVGREFIHGSDLLAGGADLLAGTHHSDERRTGQEVLSEVELDGLVAASPAFDHLPLGGRLGWLWQVLRVERALLSVRPYFSGGMLFSAVGAGSVHATFEPGFGLSGLFHVSSVRQPHQNVNYLGGRQSGTPTYGA